MSTASECPRVVVRYSKQGRESIWDDTASRDLSDGPAAAAELVRRFSAAVGSDAVRLRVVPGRPGGPQAELAPVLGQSLAAFLEHCCHDDHGAYQLRAEFNTPSSEAFVLVRVAFPGTTPSQARGKPGGDQLAMLVEQFECAVESDVSALKAMIQRRTRFPMSHMVLLLGCRRLHNELPMGRVTAEASGTPLQLHLAIDGAYTFLRREGQGHSEVSGSCSLVLKLPSSVHGSRVRSLKFTPSQSLDDLKCSVQAVSGLSPAIMQFMITAPVAAHIDMDKHLTTLETLDISDGCTLQVTLSSPTLDTYEIPLDTPTSGCASLLYERAAMKLGLTDSSHLALFVGREAISPDADICCTPLADGVVLSAYKVSRFQISYSVLPCGASEIAMSSLAAMPSTTASSSTSSTSSTPLSSESTHASPTVIPCCSSDSVEKVRERIVEASGKVNREIAAKLRNSKIFAVDSNLWDANSSTCTSLRALAKLLGHSVPCNDGSPLSRLGIADGLAHLVLVPERQLLVEIQIHVREEVVGIRKLRVHATLQLADLANLLERNLQDQGAADFPLGISRGRCQWALPGAVEDSTSPVGHCTAEGSQASSPSRGVTAMIGTAAAAVVKRASSPPAMDHSKRRRISVGQTRLDELSPDEFVGDLHAEHPAGQREVPDHCVCPISYEVMRDPVLVSGSGNTYDRKSIERHFEHRNTDPITNVELKNRAERRLVPNNSIRSLVDDVERSFVDLRLAAIFGERPRRAFLGDSPVSASLKWCKSLLRNS